MDDFLYFLLLIGWLGYSIYKQSEKKKKLLAKKQALETEPVKPVTYASEPYVEVREKPIFTEPDFAKTLEEILVGKSEIDSLEEIPETEVQSLETIPEPAKGYAELNKEEFARQPFVYDGAEPDVERTTKGFSEEASELVLIEEDATVEREDLHHFNLRRAVVYSEILNRKYS
jgi:hypothetical protein